MQQDVLEKLFGKKVRASAASDSGAGGSAGAGGRKKKKAEVTSVLDGKTQQNLGIMVARLRMPTAAVKTMVRAGTRTKHSASAPAHRVSARVTARWRRSGTVSQPSPTNEGEGERAVAHGSRRGGSRGTERVRRRQVRMTRRRCCSSARRRSFAALTCARPLPQVCSRTCGPVCAHDHVHSQVSRAAHADDPVSVLIRWPA